MSKRLFISLIFRNLVVIKTLSLNHRMYNLYTKFVKILEICKQFSENLVNESGNHTSAEGELSNRPIHSCRGRSIGSVRCHPTHEYKY